MSEPSSSSSGPLAAFSTIQLTEEDIRLRYHHVPKLTEIYLPERLQSFPRTTYEENFGHSWYLYEEGGYEWKLRWVARAASHAWTRAIAAKDIDLVISSAGAAQTSAGHRTPGAARGEPVFRDRRQGH